MALDEIVQKSILHEISRWSHIIKERDLIPVPHSQEHWKYKSSSDWHYGHFVGLIEGIAIMYHHVLHHREITREEIKEIESIIENKSKDIRAYFASFD